MRRSDLVQHKEKEKGASTRTTQIVFGERQHLLRVLDSLEGTDLPIARMTQERRILEELIHARTRDLNQINTAWAGKTRQASAGRGFLFAAADQRASARQRQDAEQTGETSVWGDSRKCGAASQCGRSHADVAEPGSQPAALVSRGFQSQHAHAATAAPARSAEASRRKSSLQVSFRSCRLLRILLRSSSARPAALRPAASRHEASKATVHTEVSLQRSMPDFYSPKKNRL